MNSKVLIAFVACFVAAQAGVLVGHSAQVLQGPSSRTTVVGNDGSVISAVAPGGQIIHEEHPGVVAHAAPVLSYAAPVVAHHAPVLAHHGSTVVAHSSAYGSEDVVVAGPSGTVATSRHAAPVVAHHAHHAQVLAHAAPVVAHHGPVVAHYGPVAAYAAGHGLEGQYVHDHSETLYDDGSYKPHYYGY